MSKKERMASEGHGGEIRRWSGGNKRTLCTSPRTGPAKVLSVPHGRPDRCPARRTIRGVSLSEARPADEAKRLVIGSPGHLREIDYWVFGAPSPAPRPLDALIAGGGTGDATIMLAQHLARAGRPGTVTWLDRSASALAVAAVRAGARDLGNIAWEQRSLLDLAGIGLGPFDYIDCCGVLHHLPDPAAGLRSLLSVLKPDGGLGLMVYAPHGRTGVYMVQDALRLLAPPEQTPSARLDVARRVMRHLPESAWLRRNTYFGDHIEGGDAGLYDLLLNPRDITFTVPQLHDLLDVRDCGYCWLEPMRYDPLTWLPTRSSAPARKRWTRSHAPHWRRRCAAT